MDGTFLVLQPSFGGMIIDIVSRNISTPEEQAQALEDIKNTILAIISIVLIGYVMSESELYGLPRMSFCVLLLGLSLILSLPSSSLSTALRTWLFSSASERVVARLRKNLFGHLVQQVSPLFWHGLQESS